MQIKDVLGQPSALASGSLHGLNHPDRCGRAGVLLVISKDAKLKSPSQLQVANPLIKTAENAQSHRRIETGSNAAPAIASDELYTLCCLRHVPWLLESRGLRSCRCVERHVPSIGKCAWLLNCRLTAQPLIHLCWSFSHSSSFQGSPSLNIIRGRMVAARWLFHDVANFLSRRLCMCLSGVFTSSIHSTEYG